MLLFVYGTLKRGGRNHRLLADQRFVREVETAPAYRVYDLGPYPGLVRDEANGLAVRGELWDVSGCALEELDDFEGVPGLFDRRPVEIDDTDEPVMAYFWARAVPADAPSGDGWPVA
jgi:gamma-glutamylaminecyclotransferase